VNRALDLPMRSHASDLFDQAHKHLTGQRDERAPHSLLVIDNAEGLSIEILDLLRRLTSFALDSEDRFSILLSCRSTTHGRNESSSTSRSCG
jgi:type II secretory pathway predicted ATPase ExeA